MESKALRSEWSKLAADALRAAGDAGGSTQKDVDLKDPAASVIRAFREYQPTVLLVRPEVERRRREGRFTDGQARDRLQLAVRMLADYNVALPRMRTWLMDQ